MVPEDKVNAPGGFKYLSGICVHELAKELGMNEAEVIDVSHKLGIGVKDPSSTVIDAQADRIRARADREKLIRVEGSFAKEEEIVRLKDLARELGLSNPELITKSFGLGIKIITADVANFLYTKEEAELVRESVKKNEHSEVFTTKQKKKKKKKSGGQAKKVTEEPETPEILAEHFQIEVSEMMKICASFGFNVQFPTQRLTIKQTNLLYEKFGTDDLLQQESSGHSLKSAIGDLLSEAPIYEARTKAQSSVKKQKNKRIPVLAEELEIQEMTLRWIVEAVRVEVLEGKQPKIDVRHEDLVKAACLVWVGLPDSKNMVDRVRLSKISKRLNSSINGVIAVCNQFEIPVINKTFLSASDSIYLQALFVGGSVSSLHSKKVSVVDVHHLAKLDDGKDSKVENMELRKKPRVQYHNLNYARQNFSDSAFKDSDFIGVNFNYSDISHANFFNCSLTESQLIRVKAVNTNFGEAIIKNCNFEFSDLTEASFLNAKFENVNFQKAIFSKTTWTDGRVIDSEPEN